MTDPTRPPTTAQPPEPASFDDLIQLLAQTIRDAAAERGSLTQERQRRPSGRPSRRYRPTAWPGLNRRLWIDAVEGFYKLYVKPLMEAERH